MPVFDDARKATPMTRILNDALRRSPKTGFVHMPVSTLQDFVYAHTSADKATIHMDCFQFVLLLVLLADEKKLILSAGHLYGLREKLNVLLFAHPSTLYIAPKDKEVYALAEGTSCSDRGQWVFVVPGTGGRVCVGMTDQGLVADTMHGWCIRVRDAFVTWMETMSVTYAAVPEDRIALCKNEIARCKYKMLAAERGQEFPVFTTF